MHQKCDGLRIFVNNWFFDIHDVNIIYRSFYGILPALKKTDYKIVLQFIFLLKIGPGDSSMLKKDLNDTVLSFKCSKKTRKRYHTEMTLTTFMPRGKVR